MAKKQPKNNGMTGGGRDLGWQGEEVQKQKGDEPQLQQNESQYDPSINMSSGQYVPEPEPEPEPEPTRFEIPWSSWDYTNGLMYNPANLHVSESDSGYVYDSSSEKPTYTVPNVGYGEGEVAPYADYTDSFNTYNDVTAEYNASDSYKDYFASQGDYDDRRVDPSYVSRQFGLSQKDERFRDGNSSNLFNGGEELVDNGTNSYLNRSSGFITKDEALRQAEYFGNDELKQAIEKAFPYESNTVISKNSLRKFGYVPFIDNSDVVENIGAKLSQNFTDAAEGSESVWNGIAQYRNDNTDWKVNYNDHKLSGKEVDEAILESIADGGFWVDYEGNTIHPTYIDANGDEVRNGIFDFYQEENFPMRRRGRYDEAEYETRPIEVKMDNGEDAIVVITQKTDDSGNVVLSPDDGFPVMIPKPFKVSFEDAVVTGDDGNPVSIPAEDWANVTKNQQIAGAVYGIAAANGEDGVSYEDVESSMGRDVDYGLFNYNAPQYASADNGLLSEYVVPVAHDMFRSSLAYFNPYTLIERAATSADLSAKGLYTASQQKDDDTGIISYDPASNQFTNTTMAVAAPVAESKVGNIGAVGGKGWTSVSRWAPAAIPSIKNPVARGAAQVLDDAAGEGAEEVATDWLYNLQERGLHGLYAPPVMDEDGANAVDSFGRLVYDENALPSERFVEGVSSIPENFVGGALLGGLMGVPGTVSEARRRTGVFDPRVSSQYDFYNQYGKKNNLSIDQSMAIPVINSYDVKGIENR